MSAVKRNDPCPCGSGKKYKKCCLLNEGQPSANGSKSNLGQSTVDIRQLRNTAIGFHRQGNFASAVALYRQVIEHNNDDVDVLFELGRLQGMLNEVNSQGLQEGIDCLTTAVRLRPQDLESHIELAKVLNKNFSAQAVLEHTDVALKRFPDNLALISQRATALIQLNHLEAAKTLLEHAQQLSPNRADIVLSLAKTLTGLKLFDAAYEKLQALLEHDKTTAADKIFIYYALGAVEDKRKNYPQAFDNFSRAGQYQLASPECQHWSAASDIKTIEQFSDTFAATKPATASTENPNSCALVFLIGFPRSGTTLTEQALAAHSKINTSEERPILGNAIGSVFARHNASYENNALGIFNRLTQNDIALVRENYWQQVDSNHRGEGSVYIDKLPLNINHIAWIQAVFPEARIILALRDPRDACLSCFFQHFAPNTAMNHFLSWPGTTGYYAKVMSQWLVAKPVLTNQWIETRYEDTVEDATAQLKKLIEFMSLEWEPDMMNYRDQLADRSIPTPSNAAIRQPINRQALARWKNYPEATTAARQDLEPLVTAFGYQW